MRRLVSLLVAITALVCAVTAEANTIPTSFRAREVIKRVRPSLEKSLKKKGFQWGAPVFVRIIKSEMCLEMWLYDGRRFRLFRRFDICTYGSKGLGPKKMDGDGFAPEGFYYVAPRQLNPYSSYHLAFNLGYPNAYDSRYGYTGSALMVHGSCVSIGCFAMTDSQMEIIYALVEAALKAGQPFFRVHIFPFPMTEKLIASHSRNKRGDTPKGLDQWNEFWKNLKEGYDYFERHNRPPNVQVRQGRYVFQGDN